MNRFFLIFIFLIVICSCTNQKVNNSASADTASGGLFTQTDSIKIKINSNFPFGCSDLLKFYPKHWERDIENYGHLKKPLGNEFDDIGKCFAAINSAKTISSPTPKSVELLKIGNNLKNIDNLDTFKQRSKESCKYRFPNIGLFECWPKGRAARALA